MTGDDNRNYWTSGRGFVSRRSLLRGVGVASLGVAGAALVGCSGDDDDKSTPAGGRDGGSTAAAGGGGGAFETGDGSYVQPTSGFGQMDAAQRRAAFDGDNFKNLPTQKLGPTYGFRARYPGAPPASWSPLQASNGSIPGTAWAHNQLIQIRSDDFEETTHFPGTWPVLAQSLPEQPDPLTYIFKLVEGVKFQNVPPVNGREMTSEDVKYSFDVYRESSAQKPALEAVESIEAIDAQTVQFKLSEPFSPFLATISAPMFWIFSREQHTSTDPALDMEVHPIGTGAWIFKEAEPNVGYSFDKNPDYFRKDPRTGMQLPYLDGLDVIRYQSGAAQTAAFRAGEIDYLGGTVLNPRTFAEVMESNPTSVGQFTLQSVGQPHFGMRQDKAPYNDVRLRRALSMLIDRDTIIETILEGNGIHGSGQMWTWWEQPSGFPVERLGQYYQHNPAEAKKLLAAMGLEDMTIPMYFGVYTQGIRFDVMSAAVAMWEAAGLKVEIETTTDFASEAELLYGKKMEAMFSWSDVPPGIDPDIYTYQVLKTDEPNNIYYVSDPKIDELCVLQRQKVDPEERKEVLDDLLDYTLDVLPRIELPTADKINIRGSNVFNLVDNSEFWSIFGWGPQMADLVWKSSDRPA